MNKPWVLNTSDEMETFNSRDFWTEEDGLIESLSLSLSPHSGLYYSDLSPLFSYEIQKIDSLNLFSHIHLRDGAALLLNFFLNQPDPKVLRTKISVHHTFHHLIPSSWIDHVQFVELVSKKSSTNDRLYYAMGNKIGFDTIEHLKKLNSQGKKEINILSSLIGTLGSHERSDMAAQFIKLSTILKKELPDADISFVELSTINQQKVNGSQVVLDNHLLNYCSDSYIQHYLLSLGACSESVIKEDTNFIELGLNYGYQQVFPQIQVQKNDEIWNLIKSMNIQSSRDKNISREFGQLEQYLDPALVEIGQALLEGNFRK